MVRGGSNVTVKRMTIIGNHSNPGTYTPGTPEFQAGVGYAGVSGGIIELVNTRSNMGDGVGIYQNGTTPSRDIVVRKNSIIGNGRMGVAVTHATNIIIEDNTFDDIAWAVIDLEPDGGAAYLVDGVIIRRNLVTGQGSIFFSTFGPNPVRNVLVENNVVKAGANRGIWSFINSRGTVQHTDMVFRNNTGEQPFWEDPCVPSCRSVILIENGHRITVTGNTQPVTAGAGMVGVLYRNGSTSISVSGNTFTNAIGEYRQE